MNNDPSSSSSRPRSILRHTSALDQIVPEEASASEDDHHQNEQLCLQRDQKATFLDHLIRNIDIMIYCELSILYYMDISFFKFIFRAVPQWIYFTPKPTTFHLPPVTARPYISTIFSTNLICLFLHVMFSPPAAGEDTRGYLHGGIFIDFVGQKSPVSKITLALLDILLLGLQLVILAVVLERRKIGVPSASTDAAETSPVQPQVQDHDSEERGVLRPPLSEGIELQTLSSGRTGADQDHERDELLSPTSRDFQHPTDLAAVDEHPLNTFYSGQHIIADFYILDTIRTQWMQYSGVATAAGGTGPEIQATPRQGRVVGLQIGRFRIRGRLTA